MPYMKKSTVMGTKGSTHPDALSYAREHSDAPDFVESVISIHENLPKDVKNLLAYSDWTKAFHVRKPPQGFENILQDLGFKRASHVLGSVRMYKENMIIQFRDRR